MLLRTTTRRRTSSPTTQHALLLATAASLVLLLGTVLTGTAEATADASAAVGRWKLVEVRRSDDGGSIPMTEDYFVTLKPSSSSSSSSGGGGSKTTNAPVEELDLFVGIANAMSSRIALLGGDSIRIGAVMGTRMESRSVEHRALEGFFNTELPGMTTMQVMGTAAALESDVDVPTLTLSSGGVGRRSAKIVCEAAP